jgi:uncharacterized protein
MANGQIFIQFFYLLRAQGIPVSISEWLTWLECLTKGLVAADLSKLYRLGRMTLIKHEKHLDLYDQCFAYFFGNATAPEGLSEAVDAWLQQPLPMPKLSEQQWEAMEKLDLERLKEMFEERLKEQKERHDGGHYWVGTGGRSPFGHNGRHVSGMRVGGRSMNRSAMQVVGERRFQAYRNDRILDTRSLSTALRKLRLLGKNDREEILDIEGSIKSTAQQAGELSLQFKPERSNQLKLLLLVDIGGSMDDFIQLMERLMSAAHQMNHFKFFKVLYFHNCIYQEVYQDANFKEKVSLQDLKRMYQKDTRLMIVGDACMSPYELMSPGGYIQYGIDHAETGLESLQRLQRIFSHHVWLNPLSRSYWNHITIRSIGDIFPMFELTLDGLEESVKRLAGRSFKTHKSL